MKVGELIELLQAVDADREVVIQRDRTGNGHSPLHSFWRGAYKPDGPYGRDAGLEELTPEDRMAGFSEDDVIADGVKALILVPVN